MQEKAIQLVRDYIARHLDKADELPERTRSSQTRFRE